jgi:hypothetical protein
MAVKMSIVVFWGVKPCSLAGGYQDHMTSKPRRPQSTEFLRNIRAVLKQSVSTRLSSSRARRGVVMTGLAVHFRSLGVHVDSTHVSPLHQYK